MVIRGSSRSSSGSQRPWGFELFAGDGEQVVHAPPLSPRHHEDDEVAWTEARDGLLWDVTASHERCSSRLPA